MHPDYVELAHPSQFHKDNLPPKNAIQTLRHEVNFLRHEFCCFFRQSKKIESQSGRLSTIKVSAESNDRGVKA